MMMYPSRSNTAPRIFVSFLFLLWFGLAEVSASMLLIPMDAEGQENHLKAYGITYWVLTKQQKVQWLLNYRGGSFLLPHWEPIRNE